MPTWRMALRHGDRAYWDATFEFLGGARDDEWTWFRSLSRWEQFTHEVFGRPAYPGGES